MGWMDDAMVELRPWIGRVRTVEDDIGMMSVRRVASTFNVDPDSIKRGDPLPPHWFTVFFGETIVQGDLGPDGHPNKGIVLPPIPMPRRMGAGRRVQIMGRLKHALPGLLADVHPLNIIQHERNRRLRNPGLLSHMLAGHTLFIFGRHKQKSSR